MRRSSVVVPPMFRAEHARDDIDRLLVWTIHNRMLAKSSGGDGLRSLDAALDRVDIRQVISTAQASAQVLVAVGDADPGLVGPKAILSSPPSLPTSSWIAVVRPADVAETIEAWRFALGRVSGPTAIVVDTRAARPLGACPAGNVATLGARGDGYGVFPDVTLLASGPDVQAALTASRLFRERGHRARVLSVPYRDRFDALTRHQRQRLIGDPRVIVAIDSNPTSPRRADFVVRPSQCDRTLVSRIERLFAWLCHD